MNEYLQNHYPTNYKSHERMIKRFTNHLQEQAQSASYKDIANYITHLRSQQLHPKTIRNNLFAIKIYYRYLIEMKVRDDHPCEKLKLKDKIDKSIALEGLYSSEELENYLQNHKAKNPMLQKRDEVLISLLIYQGLSTSEVTALKISDIDLEKGTIKIQSSIKRNARTLPLKPNQIMLFFNYINNDRKKILLLENEYFVLSSKGKKFSNAIVNEILNDHKKPNEKLQAKKIRQSVIANYLKEKKELRVVQVFAGHRKATATENYKQTGLDDLKSSIEQLHPLQWNENE